jgi:hypothetical protein
MISQVDECWHRVLKKIDNQCVKLLGQKKTWSFVTQTSTASEIKQLGAELREVKERFMVRLSRALHAGPVLTAEVRQRSPCKYGMPLPS